MRNVCPAAIVRATFPRQARLLCPAEFTAGLKGRRVARGTLFVLTAARITDEPSQPGLARLGLVIAKRYAARASTRNAIKRVVREAFRAVRVNLPAADYVVRLHTRVPPASLTQIKIGARFEVDAHFRRALR